MKKHYFLLSSALFLAFAVVFAQEQNVPVVSTEQVQVMDKVTPRRFAGIVEAIEHVDIVPRVTGNLLKAHFEEGAIVKQGTLLYEIEDVPYKAAVDGLRADLEALNAALIYATKDFDRATKLRGANTISQADHDKSTLEINAAKAHIKRTAADLKNAENTLSYTKIYAPMTGRIGKSSFTAGNLLTPQGGKLTDIVKIAPIYVRFNISERTFREAFGGQNGIKKNAEVRIQLADGSIPKEKASVTLISNKINATTNTITLWATFLNQDHELIPGGYVTVLLTKKTDGKRFGVRPSALITVENGYSVYVVNADGVVEARMVKTGDISTGLVTIESGLNGSETVIVDGMQKVRPGMKVRQVSVEKK